MKKDPSKLYEERTIKALKKIRIKKGLSPEELDEKARFNKGFIRWIEGLNYEGSIQIADIYKIAKALNCSPLITFTEDPSK